jgi:hypothetical protein
MLVFACAFALACPVLRCVRDCADSLSGPLKENMGLPKVVKGLPHNFNGVVIYKSISSRRLGWCKGTALNMSTLVVLRSGSQY